VDGRSALPADLAGLKTGDSILSVDGQGLRSFSELQKAIAASNGNPETWRIDRSGTTMVATVTPTFDSKEKRSIVGVYPLVAPVVKDIKKGSEAELAGFRPGDRITAVNEVPIASSQAFFQALTKSGKNNLTVSVLRGAETTDLLLVPDDSSHGPGIEFDLPTFPAVGAPFPQALREGWNRTTGLLGQIVDGLGQLFTGKTNVAESLSGPLRITYYVGEVASQGFLAGWGQGWGAVVNFLAFISLALFLMNLLPIPALDGGSIVVSAIEGLRRKPLGLKALMRYQQVGVVVVLGLVMFTTFNDIGFLLGPK